MKLISWNVNGLRACEGKGFSDAFRQLDADFFCLQETKMQEGQLDLAFDGYKSYWNYAEKKGYSGTAIFTRHEPLSVTYGIGIDEHDHEGRVITLEMPDFYLVTVYTPNSQDGLRRLDYRMKWEDDFRNYLLKLDAVKPVIACGDMNVAHKEIDLKNPKTNRRNAGFTDEEREKFTTLLSSGFTDTFRHFHPDLEGAYSWWSYRFHAREKNAGWRIDYFIVSNRLVPQIKSAAIHNEIYGSDHCPVELVLNTDINIVKYNNEDYISLTDMARSQLQEHIIFRWLSLKSTIEYLGEWEILYNTDFNCTEFGTIKNAAGSNNFVLSVKTWIERTNAIGIYSKAGRYGGTYAHRDIAYHFGMWISPKFQLLLIKEYQRLKSEEQQLLGWSAKRELSKINYRIHTDAIKQNLIPKEVTPAQANIIYANEADVLNVAMFGMTAKQWRESNHELKGNIRDYATINELICLSNMENLNAVFIEQGIPQSERLIKLNQIAIHQMSVLESGDNDNRKLLK